MNYSSRIFLYFILQTFKIRAPATMRTSKSQRKLHLQISSISIATNRVNKRKTKRIKNQKQKAAKKSRRFCIFSFNSFSKSSLQIDQIRKSSGLRSKHYKKKSTKSHELRNQMLKTRRSKSMDRTQGLKLF